MSRKAKTAVNLDTISKRYDFTVSLQNDTVLATPGKQLVIEGTNSNSIDEPLGMNVMKEVSGSQPTTKSAPLLTDAQKDSLMYSSAMNVAKSPFSEIFTTALMIYFIGNSLQIISILMLVMAFVKPISRISDFSSLFQRFESPRVNLIIPKLIYIGLNLVILGVCVWKANKMGLVPTWRELLDQPPVPLSSTTRFIETLFNRSP